MTFYFRRGTLVWQCTENLVLTPALTHCVHWPMPPPPQGTHTNTLLLMPCRDKDHAHQSALRTNAELVASFTEARRKQVGGVEY